MWPEVVGSGSPAPCEVRARAELRAYMDFSQNEKSCMKHLHTLQSVSILTENLSLQVLWYFQLNVRINFNLSVLKLN